MIGSQISQYKIESKLGEGGMGAVYLATDTTLGRKVALKFLSDTLEVSDGAHERFMQEARATARLSNPHVVTLYEIGKSEDRPFLAMEFVDGQPLSASVASEKSVEDAVQLVVQVATGLAAAHEQGIVHRDLKPDNILVSRDGTAKITDFGLARLKGASRLTRSGTLLGTISYMAPEQVEGRVVDQRADIFALGVILYELICGRRPFDGENEATVLYEILSATPQPMSRYSRDVPEALEQLVMRALAKDPEERYQSAAEFLAALQEIAGTGLASRVLTRPPVRRRIGLTTAIAGAAAIVALTFVLTWIFRSSDVPPGRDPDGRAALAVLPFTNIGNPAQEYFADGLTDEIAARIGRLQALSVISHASAMVYKGTAKATLQIAKELGVDYLLEGTVRWQGESGADAKIRVTPRLIRATDNTDLWNDSYDARMADVFSIQTEIAEKVAAAMNVALFESDRADLAATGTDNLEAYDLYLRANEYFNRGFAKDDLETAVALYNRAILADSSFAPAYARLARTHAKIYWWAYDPTRQRLDSARAAVDRALAIDPELAEAHIALGYYHYWGNRDYELALAEFDKAKRKQPNSSDLLQAVGYVLRRQGRFPQCLENLEKAQRLDPLSAEKAYEVGNTYYRMRNWQPARHFFDRAILLAPDWSPPYALKARSYVYENMSLDSARAVLTTGAAKNDPASLTEDRVWVEVLAGDADAALAHLDMKGTDTAFFYIMRGEILELQNNTRASQAAYDSARVVLEDMVRNEPDVSSLHRYLGIVLAELGRADDAIREAQQAVALLPVAKDPFHGGPSNLEALARVQALSGHADAAIASLRELLALPAGLVSPAYLRVAPAYRKVQGLPAFTELLMEVETSTP